MTKDDSQDSSPSSPANTSTDSDVIILDEIVPCTSANKSPARENGQKKDGETSSSTAETTNSTENETEDAAKTGNDSEKFERKLKVISMGAPVPKSIKPRLPPLQNWAVGMGELLHFENLPTSTGAYKDKMKGIIDKIRSRHTDDQAK